MWRGAWDRRHLPHVLSSAIGGRSLSAMDKSGKEGDNAAAQATPAARYNPTAEESELEKVIASNWE